VTDESPPIDFEALAKALDPERLAERLDALDHERDLVRALIRAARSQQSLGARQRPAVKREGAVRA
jgi:hypothetical protein